MKGNMKISTRAEEIQLQMQALASRDVQLWSITLLIVIVLASGFAAIVAPNLAWNTGALKAEGRYLPQVFFGLISLILLFNLYVFTQKKMLAETRKALLQELIFNGKVDGLSLVDPVTRLFNRRALDQMLAKEVARANRLGSSLSLLLIDLNSLGNATAESNGTGDSNLLEEVAQLMTSTFRGADTVFRYGESEFLVVMPDTTELQAEIALQRFMRQMELRKQESPLIPAVGVNSALGVYIIGASISDLLDSIHRRVFLKKHKLAPVF
ncbi:MAG: diguanylate cyclase [Acidobacteriaceae bacterium]|jgi:diguanylate cyclase (GGDEF)-like protein|nr:diguanylate cyclase [Acidobacteriaceae bacterium]